VELHNGLWDAWSSFHLISLEWSDRDIDDPAPELDKFECKLLRRPFRNGIEPALGDHDGKCELFASQPE
jgi:hypothetical protein